MNAAFVRTDWKGTSLRLFAEEAQARKMAAILARGALQRYEVQHHESGLGWIIFDREGNRFVDAAGGVTFAPEPGKSPRHRLG